MLFDRLILVRDPGPHAPALNMALDETLLATAAGPLLRIYRWECPAVSFGYFGKHTAIAATWPGWPLVRRMTGGGAVEHGADITYTLVVPAAHPLAGCTARESYRRIHAALSAWLAARGIEGTLAAAPHDRGNGVCFQSAAEADVLAAGRKIAGAAQRRTARGLLYQGSILGIPHGWRDELPAAFSGHITARDFTDAEAASARALAQEKYATRAWTERV